jgi:predicted ATP-binding protein involved in virulence
MRLINIKITGLFDLFSYNISLNREEDLTILTGPNGYGKTTVLNILYSLFNSRFYYFHKLVFKEIILQFDNEYRIEVKKIITTSPTPDRVKIQNGNTIIKDECNTHNSKIVFNLFDATNKNLGAYEYNTYKEEGIKNQIERYIPFVNKISPTQWMDERTNHILNFDELLYEYAAILPPNVLNSFKNYGLNNKDLLETFNSFPVYLIKEQRLLRQYSLQERRFSERNISYINTIQEYAKELSSLIQKTQVESLQITQQLDSSFPKRLLNYTEKLSEQDFTGRFESLKKKYEKLREFGLLTTVLDIPQYSDNAENAKVLTVYLSDSEKKTAVFDELLNKIELFTNILNQKRFTFKSIQIDKDNGFVFKTSNGQPLSLSDLSSGEQHEVVLLYELLFKVQPDTLVLIDEPEISLHISWQHAFVDDLIKIAEMQKIRFIIATHSPMIINNRFDLSVDLFALTQKNDNNVNS